MNVEFSKNISPKEQQATQSWLENHKLHSCRIIKIDGINYNFIFVFEDTQIVAIRVIK